MTIDDFKSWLESLSDDALSVLGHMVVDEIDQRFELKALTEKQEGDDNDEA